MTHDRHYPPMPEPCEWTPPPAWLKEENFSRISACLTACKGLADPARDVAELRETLRDLFDLVTLGINPGRDHEWKGKEHAMDLRIMDVLERARAVLARTEAPDAHRRV